MDRQSLTHGGTDGSTTAEPLYMPFLYLFGSLVCVAAHVVAWIFAFGLADRLEPALGLGAVLLAIVVVLAPLAGLFALNQRITGFARERVEGTILEGGTGGMIILILLSPLLHSYNCVCAVGQRIESKAQLTRILRRVFVIGLLLFIVGMFGTFTVLFLFAKKVI